LCRSKSIRAALKIQRVGGLEEGVAENSIIPATAGMKEDKKKAVPYR
jgi:hypothetical protein